MKSAVLILVSILFVWGVSEGYTIGVGNMKRDMANSGSVDDQIGRIWVGPSGIAADEVNPLTRGNGCMPGQRGCRGNMITA